MTHPDWALKHKTKGLELRNLGGKYYLYRVSSVWDKEKKRAKKITHEMVGRVTEEDGLIPRGTKLVRAKSSSNKPANNAIDFTSISTKEYAATSTLQALSTDIIDALKTDFSEDWQNILVLAMNRLLYQSPLKNMEFLYEESFASEQLKMINLNKNNITKILQTVGADRDKVTLFMKKFIDGAEQLVFDVTDVVSNSKKMKMSEKGYNSHHNYDPQVNLFYMFSVGAQMPVYYRIFPGNISGMTALDLCIKEVDTKAALMIGDKGFFSKQNMRLLEKAGVNFILPLKRNNSDIDYTRLKSRLYEQAYDGHFFYQGRPVSYYSINADEISVCGVKPQVQESNMVYIYRNNNGWYLTKNGANLEIDSKKLIAILDNLLPQLEQSPSQEIKILDSSCDEIRDLIVAFANKNELKISSFDYNKKIVVFHDASLQCEEQNSYLARIDSRHEDYSIEGYKEKQLVFGTIAMITNLKDQEPSKIYENYKTRMEVETVFYAYKNLLEADRSYMQSDNAMNAWMFINHISVMMYYKLLNLIKSKDLIAKISPRELLMHLAKVNKIRINEQWHLAEINSKSRKIFEQLGISIT